jgi:hypothetical protein
MDYDGNLATHVVRQMRIRQIRNLLINANVGEDAPQDGFDEARRFRRGRPPGVFVSSFTPPPFTWAI